MLPQHHPETTEEIGDFLLPSQISRQPKNSPMTKAMQPSRKKGVSRNEQQPEIRP